MRPVLFAQAMAENPMMATNTVAPPRFRGHDHGRSERQPGDQQYVCDVGADDVAVGDDGDSESTAFMERFGRLDRRLVSLPVTEAPIGGYVAKNVTSPEVAAGPEIHRY